METKIIFKDGIRVAVYDLLSISKGFRRIRMLTLNLSEAYLQEGFTLSRIITRLCGTNARVVVVVGNRPAKEDLDFFRKLSEWGVRLFFNEKLHAKVIISERAREEKSDLLITSANFTTTGLHYSYEAGVYFTEVEGVDYEKFNSYVNAIIGSAQPLERLLP